MISLDIQWNCSHDRKKSPKKVKSRLTYKQVLRKAQPWIYLKRAFLGNCIPCLQSRQKSKNGICSETLHIHLYEWFFCLIILYELPMDVICIFFSLEPDDIQHFVKVAIVFLDDVPVTGKTNTCIYAWYISKYRFLDKLSMLQH